MAISTNGLQISAANSRAVIRHHIAEIIISEEIGFSKPAKEFFEIAVARLGNPSPRDVLMIGDGLNSDIVGAHQFGIDACWYMRRNTETPLLSERG